MRYRAFSVIFAAILAASAGKSAVADDIPPANLVGDYGFSAVKPAVKPAVVSACYRIEKSDLQQLNDAYRCWSEADHAFCTHLHQRLALVVYTSAPACWAGRQAFGTKP